jgi:acyl-ACP thioesterase
MELVDEPAEGRVFERTLLPGIADAGGDGRVRLDALARWLQDVAYADLLDAGVHEDGAWIVRRARMRVERFPRFGDPVTLRTFCSGLGRFSAERRTSVTGPSAAVETVAIWVWIDAQTARPKRFASDFVSAYERSAAGRDASVRLHHPDPPADAEQRSWAFRATDEDIAGHVNNSHYWVPLEAEFAADAPTSFDAEIEYREPMHVPGAAAILRAPGGLWTAREDHDAGNPVSASIQIAERISSSPGQEEGSPSGRLTRRSSPGGSSASSS